MMERRRFIINTAATAGLAILGGPSVFAGRQHVQEGKRIGMIGLDTSHSEVFTKIINAGNADTRGYRVVAAYPHGTKDIPSVLERKPAIIKAVKDLGVELVDSIEELIKRVDVVLLESNDGRPHLEQAIPVFKARKRMFIDKPVAANLKGAQAIFEAAEKYQSPVFSSSALRYDGNVQKVAKGSIGKVMGADVYTPATLEKNHSDLAWYAIHGIEMLFTVMGPGCKSVTRTYQEDTDMVVGVWNDGRIGTVRGIRRGSTNIAGTAFGDNGIAPLGPFSGYEPLIREIIHFFETGKPPVTSQETLEIFRFIQAADDSKRSNGKTVLIG